MRMLNMVPISALVLLGIMCFTSKTSTTAFSIPMVDPYYLVPEEPIGVKPQADTPAEETKIVEMFHVQSDIRYRFATTQMVSRVRNIANFSQAVDFEVTLPKEAFIMSFNMEIDGKVYDGEVKEKGEAKKQYQAAVDKGQSAGHVRQAPRHANIFQVDVNVAKGSAVTFTLTYQEMLRRKLGKYEHEIHVSPGQSVDDFLIEVVIRENKPLTFVNTPALRKDSLITNEVEDENELTIIDRPTPEVAHILFDPGLDEQGDEGISARFAVQYDVEHSTDGEVLMVDGYFVHFFSPDYQPMPKDIVFVLDVSGSMYGEKMAQLKTAMTTILGDLNPEDRFNIITFSSRVMTWKEGLVDANTENLLDAYSHVDRMHADGMTNINQALLDATKAIKRRRNQDRVAMIFFLTDGVPTEGEQDSQLIAANVWAANENNALIFSLAFGSGADYDSLVQISVQNNGFARKIYEASDADLQVSNLYQEISAVAMKDIKVNYLPEAVDEFTITETNFPVIFNGSEIIICGVMAPEARTFQYEISGQETEGDVQIVLEVDDLDNVILNPEDDEMDELFSAPRDFRGIVQKMWAYMTIKQLLLEKERSVQDEEKVKELTAKILEMSIKYKFVTPLTSMVVTKPEGEEMAKEMETGLTASDEVAALPGQHQMMHSSIPTMKQRKGRPHYRQHSMGLSNSPSGFPGLPGLPPQQGLPSGQYYYDPASQPLPAMVMPTRRMHRTTTTTTTRTTTTAPTTSTSMVRQPKLGSVLSSITGSHGQLSLCLVPKRWRSGTYTLLETFDGVKFNLETVCNQGGCKVPNLNKLTLGNIGNSGNIATIMLDGSKDPLEVIGRSSQSLTMRVTNDSPDECEIHLFGASVKVTRKLKRKTRLASSPAYFYSISFTVNPQKSASGLVGDFLSQSEGQLKSQTNKRASRVCRSFQPGFSVLVKNKNMRPYGTTAKRRNRNTRKNRQN